MKLKYYLRGLGIGILVTAVILGITGKDGTMSDEEIKLRAKELGMVEQRTLADLRGEEEISQMTSHESENNKGKEQEDNHVGEKVEASTPTKESETTNPPETTSEPVPTKEPEDSREPETTEEPKVTEPAQEEEIPQVTEKPGENVSSEEPAVTEGPETDEIQKFKVDIIPGDTSYSVCIRLQEMGLIDDALSFDKYLCKMNYDKKLNIGSFTIEKGMTEEEIAKTITRTK